MRRWLAVLLALCCSGASAQTLTVSVAASVGDALREIAPMFEAERPGVKVRVNAAASGVLLQQIAQGAAVDVFVSADVDTAQRGIGAGLLDAGSRRDIASNTLVLIVPADGGLALTHVQALREPAVRRIAVGKPATVPAGRYAHQALQAAGLWETLQGRLVLAENVRQVLDYVARGEVDAGIVYRSDVAAAHGEVREVAVLGGHDPIRYPALITVDSRERRLAQDFLAYLTQSRAAAVLARRGLGAP